ncbi:hypothetical protein ACFX13_035013 [Malus domestica]
MSPTYTAFRRSLPKPHTQASHHRHTLHRTFFVNATTIKWVRDRGLDHAVEREKNLKPLINIKNFIKLEPSKSLPISIHRPKIPTRSIEFIPHKGSASWSEGLWDLELVYWRNVFASSVTQNKALAIEKKASARKKKAMNGDPASKEENQIVFPMEFLRGFEMDKKFKKWIDERQKLPYVSPNENAAHLSSNSDTPQSYILRTTG